MPDYGRVLSNMNIKEATKYLVDLPWVTKIELLLYPGFLLWRMPIAWMKSLWAARIFLNGQWHQYMGFHLRNSINNLFYRTQWINMSRHGVNGVSPNLGLGAYPLKKWFHLSFLGSSIYANAGAVTTLLGTLLWVFSHLIWLDQVESLWLLGVIVALFFSTTAYAMAFARQNYQILGWMWLPLALYGVSSENWIIASFCWFAAGLGGITQIFFGIFIMAIVSMLNETWLPLLVLIPAIILTTSRFLPLLRGGGLALALINIAKWIGITTRKVRYNRGMNRPSPVTIYFFSLYLGASLAFWLVSGDLPVLLIFGAVLFPINQNLFRIADEQSLIILNVSLWTVAIVKYPYEWLLFGLFWIVVSPLGFFLQIQNLFDKNGGMTILANPPFNTDNLLKKLGIFFAPVKSGDTVYFAFKDPNGQYKNIFDGYRVLHEAPLCIAAEKAFHLLPDWYAVAETNYAGAPLCWGRTVEEVKDNCKRWDAKYAVIYQDSGSVLDANWLKDFELFDEFDWMDLSYEYGDMKLWPENKLNPKWFLLKPRLS